MDDLSTWLLEAIAEDERMARDAIERTTYSNRFVSGRMAKVEMRPPTWSTRAVVWPPERVLAECEAKRGILELHAIVHRDIGWLEDDGDGQKDEAYAEIPVCGHCVPKHSHFGSKELIPVGACRTVRLLAMPYAGRPGYREEWKP